MSLPNRGRRPGSRSFRRVKAAIWRPRLEQLEARHLLAGIVHTDPKGNLFPGFEGNYYPPTRVQTATSGFLSAPSTQAPLTIAKNYLTQNAATFGVSATDVSRATVSSQYTDSQGGIQHVYLQQTYNGLPVLDAVGGVHLTKDGEVIAASVNFVSGLNYPPIDTPLNPTITPQQAVTTFAVGAGLPTDGQIVVTAPGAGRDQKTVLRQSAISADPIPVQLVYVPVPGGGVDLAWKMVVRPPNAPHWFEAAVGAAGNRAGRIVRVVDWANAATYNVFPRPVQDPLYGSRALVTDPHDPIASPFGWHDTNFLPGADTTITSGNNVNASPDPVFGPAPNGGVTLNFDFPFNPAGPSLLNTNAATTNLFYWANLAHDIAYHHGFDEPAGNFQLVNRTGLGAGGDPVNAVAQSQLAFNNAFMATPPDGQSPLMAMGQFVSAAGIRDTAFDGTIITHEYFHGISDRLTGGPANTSALNALQSAGMAEGWSDWFSLLVTMKPTDTAVTPRTTGQWVLGQPLTGPGVRRFPYSFDMTIDPLTLANYNGDLFPQQNNTEVHNAGEIWASALWDLTWLLINKYGFSNDLFTGTGGQNVAMQLIFQGLKLQPANPSFLQARDAIIAADFALNAGDNYELIWQAFARRGFGVSAVDGGANSLQVFPAFDTPRPLGRVVGSVAVDFNNNLRRDAADPPLPGIVIYADTNNNGVRDAGERFVTTRADGSYSLPFVTTQPVVIRQDLPSTYTQVLPENNAARTVTVVRGQNTSPQDFLNRATPGKVSGTIWNDLNADGIRDPGEPGIPGVIVFVDYNNDGKISVLEPAAQTDFFGNYTIQGVVPGSGYTVRVVITPGMTETYPDPAGLNGGAHTGVVIDAAATTPGIDFGFSQLLDFGDAPDSYGTTLARNGARHGILAGFQLGALIDAESNGQPTLDASGDDTNPVPPSPPPVPPPPSPDDEDGVIFLGGGITPGTTARVQVTVNSGRFQPGKLQAWVDFNRNGTFDPSERVIANARLGTGVHTLTFPVPAGIPFGQTYARFRYGYEQDLGPTGPSVAGEVEDYVVNVLPNVPIAVPDVFPGPGQPLIKQGTVDNVLDVLANDTTTTFGPPSIVPGSFPAVLPSGSRLRLNATGDKILYTPGEGVLGQETFFYQVTDGNSVSAPGQVTINVSVRDTKAMDDIVTIPAGTATATTIDVLANDLFAYPIPATRILSIQPVTPGASGLSIISGGTALSYTPPSGTFTGTQIFQYTIDDSDPLTAPSSALLTIQVLDTSNPAAAGYQAQFSVGLFDPISGAPISAVEVGGTFLVVVTSQDLRAGGTTANRGVEGAYLDLLFNRSFVEPVLNPANPRGFEITYSSTYSLVRSGTVSVASPGLVDEVGATHQTGLLQETPGNPSSRVQLVGVGPGQVQVFSVLMRAKAPTLPGQPIRIFADPADTPQGDVFIMPNNPPGFVSPSDPSFSGSPVLVPDERVFFQASGPLAILGAGEGEYVNRNNPYDVNQDRYVSPIDALLIINNLNAGLGGPLGPARFASSFAVRDLVDVNMDNMLSPIDALMVINYLATTTRAGAQGESDANFRPLGLIEQGEGEGGQSSASAPLGALMEAPRDPASAPAASRPNGSLSPSPSGGSLADSRWPAASPSTAQPTLRKVGSSSVNAEAVDDLFALLGARDDH